ncbi:hypothetical protein [Geobacter sp.]|uniref:hypothetical protein n=1 Tax=Geobacter sp. TaxID=46610 RepID=UPI0027BA2171|nr:hypothetical protein [Geobacter sp.]
MIRLIIVSSLAVTLFSGALSAYAIEGYPGKTWGDLRHEMPISGDTKENTIFDSWIEQGVYWLKWNDIMLNTYGIVRFKWDEQASPWNNTVGPGVGIALEKFFPQGLFVRTGVEFMFDQQYETGRTDTKGVVYLNWYGWWDLKK